VTGKAALVDYNRCQPGNCVNGVCVAAAACTRKLLRQEIPYERPMPDPFLCLGCADCVRACLLNAVKITRI